MSLWQVDDEATRGLMTSYYKRLKSGKGAQQCPSSRPARMLDSSDYSHPLLLGGFHSSRGVVPL